MTPFSFGRSISVGKIFNVFCIPFSTDYLISNGTEVDTRVATVTMSEEHGFNLDVNYSIGSGHFYISSNGTVYVKRSFTPEDVNTQFSAEVVACIEDQEE